MEIHETKRFALKGFELGTTLSKPWVNQIGLFFPNKNNPVAHHQRRIMLSSHDALRRNILSNWFVTSSLYRWMRWVNNSIKLPSSGKIQTWFICTLAIWIPSSTYSTFSAIFTAECGLRPNHFCQFFGGKAFVCAVELPSNRRILDKLDGVIMKFLFCVQVIEKAQKKAQFSFVGKGKLFIIDRSSRNSTLFSSLRSAWPFSEMQPRQRRFGEFWGIFTLWSRKLRF